MTEKTRQELIYQALSELGKIEEGEVPSASTYNTVDAFVEPLLEQLAADEIVYVPDPNAIETKFFLPLGRLLANACAMRFGGQQNEDLKMMDERTLRRLSVGRPSYEAFKGQYF